MRSARSGRGAKRAKQATPPMNEMREKLRSAAPVESSPEQPIEEPEDIPVPGGWWIFKSYDL